MFVYKPETIRKSTEAEGDCGDIWIKFGDLYESLETDAGSHGARPSKRDFTAEHEYTAESVEYESGGIHSIASESFADSTESDGPSPYALQTDCGKIGGNWSLSGEYATEFGGGLCGICDKTLYGSGYSYFKNRGGEYNFGCDLTEMFATIGVLWRGTGTSIIILV